MSASGSGRRSSACPHGRGQGSRGSRGGGGRAGRIGGRRGGVHRALPDPDVRHHRTGLGVGRRAGGASPDVDAAFPNGVVAEKVSIEGEQCSPLRDPLYTTDDNGRAYEMIGLQDAWDIIRASGVEMGPAHVGVVDSPVYINSGHSFGPDLHFADDKGNYPPGKPRARGLEAKDLTDQPADHSGGLSHGTRVAHIIGADPSSGTAGVAGVMGEKLTMTFGNYQTGNSSIRPRTRMRMIPPSIEGFFIRSTGRDA